MALTQGPLGQSQQKFVNYLDNSTAYVHAEGHACNFKTVGVVTFQRPKMPTNLYIDKGEAILFLCSQTTATVLVLEGSNFDTSPPQYGRLYIVKIFGIGQRVPELGPNFEQNRYILGTAEPIWLKF